MAGSACWAPGAGYFCLSVMSGIEFKRKKTGHSAVLLTAFQNQTLRAYLGGEELTPSRVKTEILCGLTVALALVPEAVAFAFVAGVHPLVGLYAAFIVGLITAVYGGRPGMISGATGALAVVMVSLVSVHGVEYLFATVVLMGILQLLAGIFHLGKFIRMVPRPVMLGFVNGLAIVIFLAQLSQFKVTDANGVQQWMGGTQLMIMMSLVFLTMLLIYLVPKVTSAVPAPLVAIVAVSLLVIFGQLDTRTVGDLAQIGAGLPSFHIPTVPLTFETLKIIVPYALILAAIGLIESLLTLNLVNDKLEKRGGASKECVAQGTANVVSGFFGSMGGCAMIGQTMINVSSGGRTRISGIAAALFLLAFILFASGLIEQIPLAALVGVMFMVVIGTFAWDTFQILPKIPWTDAFVLILVSLVTVLTDLAVAVVVGVIVSALVFAWESAKHVDVRDCIQEATGAKVYHVTGQLFFSSTAEFQDVFDPSADPDKVIIDFKNARVWDHSALEAIEALAARYDGYGKTLVLRHLSRDCQMLLERSGMLIVDKDSDDPNYGLAVDYESKYGSAH